VDLPAIVLPIVITLLVITLPIITIIIIAALWWCQCVITGRAGGSGGGHWGVV
jgi:hypothetical protein